MRPNLGLWDIQGLDAISWWPLAPGWWILIGIVAFLFGIGAVLSIRRRIQHRTWQYRTLQKLNSLENELCSENSQKTAIELSTLVRRIAIQRHSRKECASLKGDNWLQFLQAKDAKKFNWVTSARSLIEAPYRPEGTIFNTTNIKETIQATKGWVSSC